ncbi:MAG TPA: hypothetical protein DCE47_12510 [Planctomycetaceae bacterium]|nr:hypothetical protein [Planctomycetaceae bacterium]|tara:strand:- start:1014 stop:1973 length:960 start_codon:yes stop_codon:yes gene_type:complete
MHIPTTQRHFWLLAAMITSLASGQALAESKVDVRLTKRIGRPVVMTAIRKSASRNAASGLARQLAPAKQLRPATIRDDRAKPTVRQQASVVQIRDRDSGLQKIGPLGQGSSSATISQFDIERLQMIETILDIRELYELDSLIGRDLANTHDFLMGMIDAAIQDLMDIIAAEMGQVMSSEGLAEDRAEYTDGTVFGWFSGWLEDLHNSVFGGKDYLNDMDGDGVPDNMDDDMDGDGIPNDEDDDRDGDGVPNKKDKYPENPKKSIFPENEVWLLSDGLPRELVDEFLYQWFVNDMNSQPLLEGDLHVLFHLAIENWMARY